MAVEVTFNFNKSTGVDFRKFWVPGCTRAAFGIVKLPPAWASTKKPWCGAIIFVTPLVPPALLLKTPYCPVVPPFHIQIDELLLLSTLKTLVIPVYPFEFQSIAEANGFPIRLKPSFCFLYQTHSFEQLLYIPYLSFFLEFILTHLY